MQRFQPTLCRAVIALTGCGALLLPSVALAGTVSGRAEFHGPDPDTTIAMETDPTCGSLHTEEIFTEQVVTSADGGLAGVLIYVREGVRPGEHEAPAEPVVIDQRGCRFEPHVTGVRAGQTIRFLNSDPTLHNVHVRSENNGEFNLAQPFEGTSVDRQFDRPEIAIPVGCDVHPWMRSYIAVLDHPFFDVTNGDGTFAIEGLPAGRYVIEAWHEHLGTLTSPIEISGSESAELSFEFTP